MNGMEHLKKIAVIGGGSWATALMKILSENKASGKSQLSSLSWWVRSEEKAEYIRQHKHNPDYISSIEFDTKHIQISANLLELVSEADTLVIAIPAAFLESALENLPKDIFKDKVWGAKGYKTIRIKNDEVFDGSFELLLETELSSNCKCHQGFSAYYQTNCWRLFYRSLWH